ncbi:caspase family protein [Dactylosporangium matsuzakiense]|uniref:Peptidase C14 caspase domain-containing protein n=1 Tax=Dactylosporangium matsuzakiense TaxID=53360 RepID=A0A9W6KQ70_9ACTN|nr:caspase family protein [Dactylosporangium matsuzakiense]GLL05100.1 hypothetical protein GCM10017581_068470 [Dactylosporangium matsuzakiense]
MSVRIDRSITGDGLRTVSKLPERFARGHALVIGVGADLPVTVRDARTVASVLEDPQRCAYPPNRIRLLTEAEASRDNVVTALDAIAHAATPDDSLLVYYSGHGVATPDGRYFLLTHGADHTRPDETALSGRHFTALLTAMPVRRLLLLLDCCRAGGIFDNSIEKGPTTVRPAVPLDVQDLLAHGKGRIVIASSRADEVSIIKNGISVFTRVLVEAFCGLGAARRDGFVYATDLALHARQRVPALTDNLQHPDLNFEDADNFRVAFYAAGSTEPKDLPSGLLPPQLEVVRQVAADVRPVLRSLRQFLVHLSLEVREVRILVDDMGLGRHTVHYESGPRVYWNEILELADLRRRMDKVFEVLDPELDGNEEWSSLKDAYRLARPTAITKQLSEVAGNVVPLTRPTGRGAQIELADALEERAAELRSGIDRLAPAESDARFRTMAMPVHLSITELKSLVARIPVSAADGEPSDFAVLNTVARVRDQLDHLETMLDHQQARRHVRRATDTGQAIAEHVGELARKIRGRTDR